jgi:hypothetical protein
MVLSVGKVTLISRCAEWSVDPHRTVESTEFKTSLYCHLSVSEICLCWHSKTRAAAPSSSFVSTGCTILLSTRCSLHHKKISVLYVNRRFAFYCGVLPRKVRTFLYISPERNLSAKMFSTAVHILFNALFEIWHNTLTLMFIYCR